MDYDSFLQLVKKRRSIRRFKPDPIPDEYVDKIVEAARWAPSGANSQPWEFVVVKDWAIKDKIVGMIRETSTATFKIGQTRAPEERHPADNAPPQEHPGYQDAPVFIIAFGDKRVDATFPFAVYLQSADKTHESGMASAFLYMHLAAASLGLASQWVTASGNTLAQALIKDLLGVPREYVLYDMMAVGYGAHEPAPRTVRTREEVTHHNHYNISKHRSDAQVKEFIKAIHEEGARRPQKP